MSGGSKAGGGSGSFGGSTGGGSFRDYVAELVAIANRQQFEVQWMSTIVSAMDNGRDMLRALMSTNGFKGKFGDELVDAFNEARNQAGRNGTEIEKVQKTLEHTNRALESAKSALECMPDPGLSVGEVAGIEAKYLILGIAGPLLAQQEIDRATKAREDERQEHAKEYLDKLSGVLDGYAATMVDASDAMVEPDRVTPEIDRTPKHRDPDEFGSGGGPGSGGESGRWPGPIVPGPPPGGGGDDPGPGPDENEPPPDKDDDGNEPPPDKDDDGNDPPDKDDDDHPFRPPDPWGGPEPWRGPDPWERGPEPWENNPVPLPDPGHDGSVDGGGGLGGVTGLGGVGGVGGYGAAGLGAAGALGLAGAAKAGGLSGSLGTGQAGAGGGINWGGASTASGAGSTQGMMPMGGGQGAGGSSEKKKRKNGGYIAPKIDDPGIPKKEVWDGMKAGSIHDDFTLPPIEDPDDLW